MSDDLELPIKDHIAIESMKILLNNEKVFEHFAIRLKTSNSPQERQKINAQMLAEASYAFAMRKARLETFS